MIEKVLQLIPAAPGWKALVFHYHEGRPPTVSRHPVAAWALVEYEEGVQDVVPVYTDPFDGCNVGDADGLLGPDDYYEAHMWEGRAKKEFAYRTHPKKKKGDAQP